jgi:hypothetical protein
MKRTVIILSALIGVVLFSVFLLNYSMKLPCDPPQKNEKIPENAVWSGGCDGGYWFEQVDYNSVHNYYRIRIYNDFDGNLELDAEFGASNTCKREYKDEKVIVRKILFYNGEQIILKENYCSLDKIKVISSTHNH